MNKNIYSSCNIEQISKIRYEIANILEEMAAILQKAESVGDSNSGKLSIEQEIDRLTNTSNNLRHKVFRLLILGDLKRGKSTFINALIGEKILPSDVNPCTALLTILRYGKEKQVTVYFKDEKPAAVLELEDFKQQYTINPDEAKILAENDRLAFPDVDYAVIEYPVPLLKKGIEIIDSPGLNDTVARNRLTLEYIYNCQAILFLFRAIQPCTLEERRYLENHLKNRGLTTFFIINGWDEIKKGLVDVNDSEELLEAETKVRQLFKANLTPYLEEKYCDRVFEISALNALRQQLKSDNPDLTATGFPQLLEALNNFLQKDRAIAEFQQAKSIAQQTTHRVTEAINKRIPLIDDNIAELKQKINSIEPEFAQLQKIRDNFQQEIQNTKEKESKAIAISFQSYMLDLEHSFERDFLEAQPELNYADFLDKNKRKEFQSSFKRAFERYINDRLAGWEFIARKQLAKAFDRLNQKAEEHQVNYEQVVATINKKLLGYRFYAGKKYQTQDVDPWADKVSDFFFVIPDNLNGAVTSFNTFWQTILASICLAIAMRIIGLLFTTIALNIFGAILLGLGTVALQAEYVRRQFLTTTKKEFIKHLPEIIAEQEKAIQQAIERCFDTYEAQAIGQLNSDIQSRKNELSNLLAQKENYQINRDREIERLQTLEAKIMAQLQTILMAC
ncbi:MAG: hypothetical protein Tsb0014_33140 [Pleurocapsa sp.]